MAKKRFSKWSWTHLLGVVIVALVLGVDVVAGAKKPPAPDNGQPPGSPAPKEESVIEEVSAKQLERVLNEKDYVAVFWCKLNNKWRISGGKTKVSRGIISQLVGVIFLSLASQSNNLDRC